MKDMTMQDLKHDQYGYASISQRSMWLINQCHPDIGLYNIELSFSVPNDLDLDLLERAINTVAHRHPLMKSIYVMENAQLCLRFLPDWWYSIETIEVGDIDDEELNERYITFEERKPFKLDEAPPRRFIFFKRKSLPSVFTMLDHHIQYDLISSMMFYNELILAYEALQKKEEPHFPKSTKYFDVYLESQNQYLKSETAKLDEEYWRNESKHFAAKLNLPKVNNSAEVKPFARGYLNGRIPDSTYIKINELAKSLQLSDYYLYICTYFIVLHKFTGQKNITVGTPASGRDTEFVNIFGYLSNLMLVNGEFDSKKSVAEILQALTQKIRGAIKHSHYPLPLIAEKLVVDRDKGIGTLCQSTFSWHSVNSFFNRDNPIVNWTDDGKRLWDMGAMGTWQSIARPCQLDEIDIAVTLHKFENSRHWGIEYNKENVDKTFIEELSLTYLELLDTLSDHLDTKLNALPILIAERQEKVIATSQGIETNYDFSKTFIDYFEERVKEFPTHPAVTFEQFSASYSELNKRANQIANWLIDHKVGPGQIVAVSLKRSIDLIACILGIMKSGAAYLPLDAEYPRDRITFMIEDSEVVGVITDNKSVFELYGEREGFRCQFENSNQFSEYDDNNPIITRSPQDMVYTIYTSGSTGRPKGVELLHRCLSSFIQSMQAVLDIKPGNNVLQFSSMNFDASIFELFASLTTGSTLHMATKESLLGDDLIQFLAARQINIAHLPPAILSTTTPSIPLPHFHTLMSGGERCSSEIVNRWSGGRTLYNAYGPTETTVYATYIELNRGDPITIGKPLPNVQVYVLDDSLQVIPTGVVGEIYIGGRNVARGYLNRPELNKERFIRDPFSTDEDAFLYRTGDLARYLENGTIEFYGRADHQVKIRGFRIEVDEISEMLLSHSNVDDALVMPREDIPGAQPGSPLLAAYVVINSTEKVTTQDLSEFLKQRLPEYMVPSAFVLLDAFPLTPSDKIDRKALPAPYLMGSLSKDIKPPRNELERVIAVVWQRCLGMTDISVNENFFDLGGHSILLARVHSELPDYLRRKLRIVDLFQYPTIQSLAHFLVDDEEEDSFFLERDDHAERLRLRRRFMESVGGSKIAIVGMAGRFPNATSVSEFWDNICRGEEAITFYDKETLLQAGIPEDLIKQPNFVPAKGEIDSIDQFDASFFNFTPREAQITDPQQRIFLECAWEALEDACCVPEKFKGRIGVFSGVGMNQYLASNLSTHPELRASLGDYPLMIGNDKDFLATRVAYKLNLNGPALVLQTACSTSLVAVHTACQAILNQECDAALAGGVSFGNLGPSGYLYQEGMIMSPDGHCRAFDEQAQGTVGGQGCGVVLLKPLDDALQNNDNIYAVIAGSATNNDGSNKTGYTAPSVEGQAKVINSALASANLDSERIGYVEAHGTGTAVGDPIEIEGLRKAFQKASASDTHAPLNEPHCAIGSVKTNVGHLDVAAGVTGLIKAAKIMQTRLIPPTLHYTKPNPKIDFSKTPFYVNTELKEWAGHKMSRYAGVSAFGLGGTNAHVILSEPPSQTESDDGRYWHIVTLSAKSPQALETMTQRLVSHLIENEQQPKHHQRFENICYSLHVGRRDFAYRRQLVCRNSDEAIAALTNPQSQRVITSHFVDRPTKVVFMFPGQGCQYANMGRQLYRSEVLFRETVDHCHELLRQKFIHFEELSPEDHQGLTERIHETHLTQPSVFIFEYAMAKLLMSWNIKPDRMIGHSFGEFAAACIAGVFTLEQALELVAIRGHLIHGLDGEGDMMMVNLSEDEAMRLTNHDVSLAAINGPDRCILSGTKNAIEYLHKQLDGRGIENRILYISHAFHSHLMEPVLERFRGYVERRTPKAPKIPFISSLTGDWITDEQATSPQYWADHLRNTVQLNRGLYTVFSERSNDDHNVDASEQFICLEVGPGKSLSTLAAQHPAKQTQDLVMATSRHAYHEVSDVQFLLKVVAKLWQQGIEIDWDTFHSYRQCYRVPLPTYPFERQSYWISPKTHAVPNSVEIASNAILEALNESSYDAPGSVVINGTWESPRNDTEKKVYQLWQACLGLSQFSIFDNYFEIGGDSLIAVNLIKQLNLEFKVPLTTPILIRKPTVAELSEHIRSMSASNTDQIQKEDTPSPLVLIQQGDGNRIPIIMVHPVGGDVFFYRDLAQSLGTEQPLYGLQAPSLSGHSEPMNSIPQMAETYIQALKQSQFKAPYLLGGSSFGGMVAYEMAQQLTALGEKVELVVMIDTPAPKEMPGHVNTNAAIIHYLLSDTLDLNMSELEKLDENAQIDYVLEAARLQGKGKSLPEHLGASLFKTWFAHQHATWNYGPLPYSGDVIYFRHTEPQYNFPPLPHLSWQEWVKGHFDVHQTPGDHKTMNISPHVEHIGLHLRPVLREIQFSNKLSEVG